jgi:hypothetical protein
MALGFALFAGTSADIIRGSAQEAEKLGYTSFWVNHPGATDGLGSLAHAAGSTQRIALGIGVIPLHTRGPESIVRGRARSQAASRSSPPRRGQPQSEIPRPRARGGGGVAVPAPDAARRRRARSQDVPARRGDCRRRALQLAHARACEGFRGMGARGRGGGRAEGAHPLRLCASRPRGQGLREAGGGGKSLRSDSRVRRALRPHGREARRDVHRRAQSCRCHLRGSASGAGVVDEVVLRAITGEDTVEENLKLLHAAKPS